MYINEQILTDKMIKEYGDPHREFVLMPRGFKIRSYNYPIYIRKKQVGYIDFIIFYRGKEYALEIKKKKDGIDAFWGATKILAYTKILALTEQRAIFPAIMLPLKAINESTLILSDMLRIALFSYVYNKQREKVEIANYQKFFKCQRKMPWEGAIDG